MRSVAEWIGEGNFAKAETYVDNKGRVLTVYYKPTPIPTARPIPADPGFDILYTATGKTQIGSPQGPVQVQFEFVIEGATGVADAFAKMREEGRKAAPEIQTKAVQQMKQQMLQRAAMNPAMQKVVKGIVNPSGNPMQ